MLLVVHGRKPHAEPLLLLASPPPPAPAPPSPSEAAPIIALLTTEQPLDKAPPFTNDTASAAGKNMVDNPAGLTQPDMPRSNGKETAPALAGSGEAFLRTLDVLYADLSAVDFWHDRLDKPLNGR